MKLLYVSLVILSLFAVISSAGCLYFETTPSVPVPTSTTSSSDQAVGNWTGVWTDTNGTKQTTITYTITVYDSSSGNVDYVKLIKDGSSSSSSEYSISADIVKADNVYSMNAQLLGVYTFTLTGNTSATLLTPDKVTVSLTKV
ncbi:hypothetical protein Mlab_1351 [Methanocorpusculum labreanum Z]|uniref:Lipoprotein n=1 Tax=Methanocorpusculum labreanum (strain ATCC 43576 / DSM 4855 / Z) TaxID=410358 RepID=A2ST62_METLZ|nr:hypothetical protein [Methanocorpusculum labreanum]ABN07518.1 hypothetical protein Mlab_1351 [Methanocorpusculum labreanum Z]